MVRILSARSCQKVEAIADTNAVGVVATQNFFETGVKDMSKELGKMIQSLMQRCGLSQKRLAELVNVTEVSMSRYISGERDPSVETLANIATALNTTTDFLLGKKETGDFDLGNITTLLARNANSLSNKQKREIINALLGE